MIIQTHFSPTPREYFVQLVQAKRCSFGAACHCYSQSVAFAVASIQRPENGVVVKWNSGIFLGYKTIKESINNWNNKSREMHTFLLNNFSTWLVIDYTRIATWLNCQPPVQKSNSPKERKISGFVVTKQGRLSSPIVWLKTTWMLLKNK